MTNDTRSQRYIVSAVPADGSAFPYSRAVTATGAHSAIRQAAAGTDMDANLRAAQRRIARGTGLGALVARAQLARMDTTERRSGYPEAPSELGRMLEVAWRDEHDILRRIARRAGVIWQCSATDDDTEPPEVTCGQDNDEGAARCSSCGAPREECAICVPRQCPGPDDCPGNYARKDEQQ